MLCYYMNDCHGMSSNDVSVVVVLRIFVESGWEVAEVVCTFIHNLVKRSSPIIFISKEDLNS